MLFRSGGGGRQLYPVDGCAKGAPERVAEVVRHHFTAVEVHDGALAVTVVAEALVVNVVVSWFQASLVLHVLVPPSAPRYTFEPLTHADSV